MLLCLFTRLHNSNFKVDERMDGHLQVYTMLAIGVSHPSIGYILGPVVQRYMYLACILGYRAVMLDGWMIRWMFASKRLQL